MKFNFRLPLKTLHTFIEDHISEMSDAELSSHLSPCLPFDPKTTYPTFS